MTQSTKSTRRGHHEGTIRQRPDGTWEARLSLPDGKRKSLYAKSQREVRDRLRAAQRDAENGLDLTARTQTVGQFLDRWLTDVAKPNLRPKTHHSYAQLVRLHLKPHLGHHQLAKLTPQHIQAMMTKQSAAGLSPRTVQYTRAVLRRALGQALKWSLVTRNVATLVDPPLSDQKEVTPLTVEQVARFLRATRDDRYGPLYHVAIGTGLRQGELFGLRWRDVDLDDASLTVRFAMQRIDGKPTFVEPKTKRSRRTLALDPTTVDALRRQRIAQLEARLLAGAQWQDWDLVFASSIGTPLESSNVTHRFQERIAAIFTAELKAGELTRQRFHDLRHCAASLLLGQGADMREIMEQLGHSQIAMTANTYTHLSKELKRATADRMGAALKVVS